MAARTTASPPRTCTTAPIVMPQAAPINPNLGTNTKHATPVATTVAAAKGAWGRNRLAAVMAYPSTEAKKLMDAAAVIHVKAAGSIAYSLLYRTVSTC